MDEIDYRHGTKKLTDAQVLDILTSKETVRELARKYNVGFATIYNIKKRITYKYVKIP